MIFLLIRKGNISHSKNKNIDIEKSINIAGNFDIIKLEFDPVFLNKTIIQTKNLFYHYEFCHDSNKNFEILQKCLKISAKIFKWNPLRIQFILLITDLQILIWDTDISSWQWDGYSQHITLCHRI